MNSSMLRKIKELRGGPYKRRLLYRLFMVFCVTSILLFASHQQMYAQQINTVKGVGISEDRQIIPDASALLELQSIERGLLVPRMTTRQRESINQPANGLLVYDLTTRSFWYWDSNGSRWKSLSVSILGDANQLLGMNADGTENEYKSLIGTPNQIIVNHTTGQIQLSTPQDIGPNSTPHFFNIQLSGLLPNAGVYTDSDGLLTTEVPQSGTVGYWTRDNLTHLLSPTNSGDNITTSGNIYTSNGNIYAVGGNIYTSNGGTITSDGLLTGNSGAQISGGNVNINANSNFYTNINTGTSSGDVALGGTNNSVYLPKFVTPGILKNANDGEILSGLIQAADLDQGAVNLESTTITGVLPISHGGTNSNTQQSAINTLAGATTAGYYLRGDGTNVTMSQIQGADVVGAVAEATHATSADNATSATNFTGSLAGDVTGTQNATVVSTISGTPAATVVQGSNLANTATWRNIPDSIVKRDSNGGFRAGAITSEDRLTSLGGLDVSGDSVLLNVDSNYEVHIADGSSTGNVYIGNNNNVLILQRYTDGVLVVDEYGTVHTAASIPNGVLIINSDNVPTISSTIQQSNLPAGSMVLLHADEREYSRDIIYNIAANSFSYILVEAEVIYSKTSNDTTTTGCDFGITNDSGTLKKLYLNCGPDEALSGVLKCTFTYRSGGRITVIGNANSGRWAIVGFRVYGVI